MDHKTIKFHIRIKEFCITDHFPDISLHASVLRELLSTVPYDRTHTLEALENGD